MSKKVMFKVFEEQRDKNLEARAEKICSFGCGIYGICYCKSNSEPNLCENKEYSKHLEEKKSDCSSTG